jgi:hypothetical protein
MFPLACTAILMAGCVTPGRRGHVVYRISGTSNSVVLNSIWLLNRKVKPADGVAELHLGLSVTKWDTGSVHVRVLVNNQSLVHDSIPRPDIGGTLDIELWWP